MADVTDGTREADAAEVERVIAALDRDYLAEQAVDLCDVSSPNGYELDAALLLGERLSALGLGVELQRFAPDRGNALGRLPGTGGGRSVILVGHLETNEFARDAPIARAGLGDDGVLTGVGMWNMKGPVAAYLAAMHAVRSAGIRLAGDVLVAGVAGTFDQTLAVETRLTGAAAFEGYSIGTRRLLERGVRADFGIVGEPTNFQLVRRHFGLLRLRIGIEAPATTGDSVADDLVSKPWDGSAQSREAIDLLAALVPAFREWGEAYRRANVLDDRAPWVTVRGMEAGDPWSGVAAAGAVYVSINTRPGADRHAITAEIADLVASVVAGGPEVVTRIDPYLDLTPPEVAEDSPLVRAFEASHLDVLGEVVTQSPVTWHSDATPLADVGIPAVNYGCRGRYVFHPDAVPDEYVALDDLADLARVYAAAIVRLCGVAD